MLVGVLVLVNPDYYTFGSASDYLVAVAEGAALVSLLGGLFGLRLGQRYSRVGRMGFLTSCIGLVMAGTGHLAGLPFFVFVDTGGMAYVLIGLSQGVPLVLGSIYLIGVPLFSAGLVLLGAAALRARDLPLWCGPALIAGLAGLWTLGNAGGWISFGLAWLAVGQALRIAVSGCDRT